MNTTYWQKQLISYLVLPAIMLLFASCGTKFSIQKRRYNKGFYFTFSQNVQPQKNEYVVRQNAMAAKNENAFLNILVELSPSESLRFIEPKAKEIQPESLGMNKKAGLEIVNSILKSRVQLKNFSHLKVKTNAIGIRQGKDDLFDIINTIRLGFAVLLLLIITFLFIQFAGFTGAALLFAFLISAFIVVFILKKIVSTLFGSWLKD